MVMPNFLIIGSAKGGTTSLYYYLNQHPQVYMSSVKEPRFFALEGEELNYQNPDKGINETSITDLDSYRLLFSRVNDEIAIGEASPLYLYSQKAAERIKHYIPDAKLIVILRDPAERAYSCYMHLVREGFETLSFADSLKEEANRIRNNWAHLWHYRQAGYYYVQLKNYYDMFNHNQIRVYLYEDLDQDSTAVIQDVYSFLNVDDTFVPDLTRMNVSGKPKIQVLQTLLGTGNPVRSVLKNILPETFRKGVAQQIRSWNLERKHSMPLDDRRQLVSAYRDDILKLQDLLQRDLSAWLK